MANLAVDETFAGATYPNLGPSIGQVATGGRLRMMSAFSGGSNMPGWNASTSTTGPSSSTAYGPGMVKPSMAASGKPMDRGDAVVTGAVASGNNMSAFAGLIGIAAILGIIMFTAKYAGKDSQFSHIQPSFYNVVFTGLVAAGGLPVIKFVFVKLAQYIPATGFLANYVNAA